jgi:hypothetical protein
MIINSDKLDEVFQCIICLSHVDNAYMCPNCSKIACFNCFKTWLSNQNTCPHCRAPIQLLNIIKCRLIDDIKNCISINNSNSIKEKCSNHNILCSY